MKTRSRESRQVPNAGRSKVIATSELGNVSKATGFNLGYFSSPSIGSFTLRMKVTPRTSGQAELLRSLRGKHPITAIVGPPGTGKTFLAIAVGLEQLAAGLIDKIIITRPAVEADEKLGFMPGGIDSKMMPYVLPIIECCVELIGGKSTRMLMESGAISIRPFAFMRGSTFSRTWVFADEMSNSTIHQMKCLLTRFGPGSKVVVAGDPAQSDLKLDPGQKNGFSDLIDRTDGKVSRSIERINLVKKDIVRHPLIEEVLDLYEE